MAKKVIWSETAVKDRLDIYQFWLHHNQSEIFSEKLEILFNEAAILLSRFPEAGTKTDLDTIRIKVIRTYKIFYINKPEQIEIVRIWDTRQDPEELKI